jgi:trimeric autotransporter adhesin
VRPRWARCRSLALLVIASVLVPVALRAQPVAAPIAVQAASTCEPAWIAAFGGQPGVDFDVHAFAVFDDGQGDGPALYAGGESLAKWNGVAWQAVPEVFAGTINALVVWDDGTGGGPALFIGGSKVVRWDGVQSTDLGSGVQASVGSTTVFSLAVHDDGSGPALFVGGFFDTAGGVPAQSIAKWDGASWYALADGLGFWFAGEVHALTSFDEGQGPVLFAGGYFFNSGPKSISSIARWDGSTWSDVAGGGDGRVYALAVVDDPLGGGPALYAAGQFGMMGGAPAANVAKWNGAAWSALGAGLGIVSALAIYDDGNGPRLYAAGTFETVAGVPLHKVARWDESSWLALGQGLSNDGGASALAVYNDGKGGGPKLFAGGHFDEAGGLPAHDVASWNGSQWSALGKGFDEAVGDIIDFDDGSGGGLSLYMAGGFTTVNGLVSRGIVRWDGSALSGVGGGLDGAAGSLAIYDDGGGSALFVGGAFAHAGGVPASNVARWDGSSWSALGSGIDGVVAALAVWDDGSGPALYAAGDFSAAGGGSANNVARWDGSVWSPLGAGTDLDVSALEVFDDGQGGGPALFAAGTFFHAGGLSAKGIAKWNGSSWSPVGGGLGNFGANALAVFDDGTGPQLCVGGGFTVSTGAPFSYVARWNGVAWSSLGGGVSSQVWGLGVADDPSGAGMALYAGGLFQKADGAPANRIARWNGSSWSALGGGTSVAALVFHTFDDGHGPALFVGGAMDEVVDTGDSYLSRWGCPSSLLPWSDLGSGLAGSAGIPYLSGTGSLFADTSGSVKLSGAMPLAPAVLFISAASSPAPFKGGTLVPVPVALAFGLATSSFGAASLSWLSWPSGIPVGATLYFQCAIKDAAALKGVALSNALGVVTP